MLILMAGFGEDDCFFGRRNLVERRKYARGRTRLVLQSKTHQDRTFDSHRKVCDVVIAARLMNLCGILAIRGVIIPLRPPWSAANFWPDLTAC